MQSFVFLDLDDTLFQSRAKCPAGEALRAAAFLRDGSAHSFMTAKQQALWRLLATNTTVIPTTARDLEAYRRVELPFRSWSILDYGGVIADASGNPDEDWLERMRPAAREALDGLGHVLEAARAFATARGLAVHVRLIEDFGLPFYLVAKYRNGRESDLDLLQRESIEPWVEAQAGAYRLHRNGNNLAVLPRTLGKEHAVRHLIGRLRREHDDILTFGFGDSQIDSAFMAECDYLLTPRMSQLFERAFGRAAVP
ncbi:hydrolase [Methylocaldum sp. MU1018]